MIADTHPKLAKLRLDMAAGNTSDSLDLLWASDSIEEQVVAVWSLNAFLRDSKSHKHSYRDPYLLAEEYESLGVPNYGLDICFEGFKKTRETLPLLFPLCGCASPLMAKCWMMSPSDVLHNLLRRLHLCFGFLSHLRSPYDYDEPEILRCSSHTFCPIGADVGH